MAESSEITEQPEQPEQPLTYHLVTVPMYGAPVCAEYSEFDHLIAAASLASKTSDYMYVFHGRRWLTTRDPVKLVLPGGERLLLERPAEAEDVLSHDGAVRTGHPGPAESQESPDSEDGGNSIAFESSDVEDLPSL